MNEKQLHVIFGTGPVGTTLAEQLLAEGHQVRLLSRSGSNPLGPRLGLEARAVDASDSTAAIAASAGASVIYNCTNVPYQDWARQLPAIYSGILAAAEEAEAALVIADSLYGYGPVTGPIHEALPLQAITPKCQLRAKLAQDMLRAHEEGRVEVAIVQGSDFFGPRVLNAHMGKRAFEPIAKGRSVYLLGDIDQPHSFTYIPDFARAMMTVGRHWQGFGRIWIAPNAPALAPRQFVAKAAQIAGTRSKAKAIPEFVLQLAGLFDPLMREMQEPLYQFKSPFVTDSSDFERAFGQKATPLDEAMLSTLEWASGHAVARSYSPVLA